jgi:hypothetical protein
MRAGSKGNDNTESRTIDASLTSSSVAANGVSPISSIRATGYQCQPRRRSRLLLACRHYSHDRIGAGDRPECGGRTKPVSHRDPDHPAFPVLHPVGAPRPMASRPPRFWTVSTRYNERIKNISSRSDAEFSSSSSNIIVARDQGQRSGRSLSQHRDPNLCPAAARSTNSRATRGRTLRSGRRSGGPVSSAGADEAGKDDPGQATC